MKIQNELFKAYSNKLITDLECLSDFQIEEFVSWELDWLSIFDACGVGGKADWVALPEYRELLKCRTNPAVYFFTIELKDAENIFQQFQQLKRIASEKRINQGVKAGEYYNVSHVPKVLKPSQCLYVGSRKKELHGRLIQHLGFGSNGRTGALYLSKVLATLPQMPKITFNYIILDNKYTSVTEHIECVLYDKLKPFIGKRAIRSDY